MSDEMPNEIVAELRIHSAVIEQLAGNIFERAADEIERLRRDYSCICNEMRRMMEERDEARRMYCEAVILHGTAHRFDANGVPEEITEAEELARRLKWDCFKENTNDR